MQVLVDVRETTLANLVRKELQIEPTLTPLPVGDIIVQDSTKQIVCERKTLADLASSIMNQHLRKQLLQMEQFQYPFLIVVGNFSEVPFKRIRGGITTVNQQLGLLASIATKYKTQILFVPNNIQLVKLCKSIFDKVNTGKVLSIEDTELLRTKMKTEDYQLKVLCALPGVSLRMAKKLKEKISIQMLVEGAPATEEGLTKIEGIGKKRAAQIMAVFRQCNNIYK